jgi:hypothetical protein
MLKAKTVEKKSIIGLMDGETIRPVPGHEGRYSVTSHGRVFSHFYKKDHRTVELSQTTHPEGYKRVKFPLGYPGSHIKVHRLVAMAFHPNPKNLPQVNHIDGNKGNNHYLNLEWTDNSGNQRHAFDTGLQKSRAGEKHNQHKLTESQVYEIKSLLQSDGMTLARIGGMYGVSMHCIFDIKKGRSWTHLK